MLPSLNIFTASQPSKSRRAEILSTFFLIRHFFFQADADASRRKEDLFLERSVELSVAENVKAPTKVTTLLLPTGLPEQQSEK